MSYYIYKFYNKGDELLYVGKTTNPPVRFINHRWKAGWHREASYIMIAECNNEADMRLYESYYINTLRPKYNKSLVSKEMPTVVLPNLVFDLYELEDKSCIFKTSSAKVQRLEEVGKDESFELIELYNSNYRNCRIQQKRVLIYGSPIAEWSNGEKELLKLIINKFKSIKIDECTNISYTATLGELAKDRSINGLLDAYVLTGLVSHKFKIYISDYRNNITRTTSSCLINADFSSNGRWISFDSVCDLSIYNIGILDRFFKC